MTSTQNGTARRAEASPSAGSKTHLRARYRTKRRALSAAQQRQHGAVVAGALLARARAAATVAVYIAQDGEIDLAPLVAQGRQHRVVFAVPVLADGGLRFAAYRADEPMRRGRHGLLEPSNPASACPALVLAPLVAFDERGHRLGMGGGHYDRYFARHPEAERVGVAHECQRAPCLPVDPWDMPLAAVVTEQGWRRFDDGAPTA